MEIAELIFTIKYKIFKFLTYGYVSEILITFYIIGLFLAIGLILFNYKLIKYTTIEKFIFMKNYFYMFAREKYYFIKFWIMEIVKNYNKMRLFYILIALALLISIIVYILWKLSKVNQ